MSNFIDKTLKDINRIFKDTLLFEETKESLQIDERIKILSLLIILILISFLRSLETLFFLFLLSILLAFILKIKIKKLLERIGVFILFTFIIVIPSIFLGYGIENAIRLILRVVSSISYVQILILSTPWIKIFTGLRGIGVPSIIISVLTITYRYIFLLLEIAENLFLAKKSRTIELNLKREQNFIGGSIGIIAIKTHELSKEVFQGMISRGFTKEIFFHRKNKISFSDILVLIFILLFSIVIIIWDGII